MCKNRTNPYLGKFNIVLYTTDDGTCCGLFENAFEFAKWLYGPNPTNKQIIYVTQRLGYVRRVKKSTKQPVQMKIATNQKYEIDFVIA